VRVCWGSKSGEGKSVKTRRGAPGRGVCQARRERSFNDNTVFVVVWRHNKGSYQTDQPMKPPRSRRIWTA
jgi:hypothetical protein